jgi:hypothetical protein
MAAELRHIIFSKQEVIEAVQGYMRRSGERIPHGVVTRITVKTDEQIGILFQVTEDVNDKVHNYYVDQDKLAASLILYCKTNRIPLPYKSEKKLQMFGSNVSMLVAKNIPVDNIDTARELLLDA